MYFKYLIADDKLTKNKVLHQSSVYMHMTQYNLLPGHLQAQEWQSLGDI